ncbi:MAG: ABC transporter permease [Actinobacteria bacterium]|nr:ABC transporter permease [Actinomycetota bacterium]
MTAFTAMVRVSVGQLLGRKWVILVGLVGLLPTIVMFALTRTQGSARLATSFQEGPMMTLFLIVLPLTSILVASLALGEERREGTLPILLLRPRRREVVVAAKLLAAWLSAWLLTGASGVLAAVVLGGASGEWGMVGPVIVATGVSALAYVAVFLVVGYLTKWAVIIGAAFLFVWETGLASAVDALANVSLFRIGLTAFAAMVDGAPSTLREPLAALTPGVWGALAKVAVLSAAAVGGLSFLMGRRDLT